MNNATVLKKVDGSRNCPSVKDQELLDFIEESEKAFGIYEDKNTLYVSDLLVTDHSNDEDELECNLPSPLGLHFAD